MKLLFLLSAGSLRSTKANSAENSSETINSEESFEGFEGEDGFNALRYYSVCAPENVNENGKIVERDSNRRRECKKYTKEIHKEQVTLEITKNIAAVVSDEEEEEEEEIIASNGMQFDVGLGMGGLDRRGVDWQCTEENIEQTKEQGGCCSRGKFRAPDSVWEYAQRGLKTVCGCELGEILCEEPNQEEMVEKRSRCSLRSNWYVKKIQKMSMNRDNSKDGNIVIKSLVGVEGFKIKDNEIFSYMRLTCDSGEFFYDGESIGDTFDFECSIMKGKKGPEGREERKALRLAKKRNEVERGQWRQTPECKRVTPLVEDKETAKSQRKKNKEVEGIDFDSISARILGGTKVAGNGEYPWQCLLITSDGSYCGCVVVDSRMILTAAHCVVTAHEADGNGFEDGTPKSLIALVIMGSNDRLSDASQRIRTTVCGVHPGFKTDGPIMYYDIAFCQLKTPIILDDPKAPVQPACLPGTLELNEERKQKMCVATGFGTTSSNSGPSRHMMSAIVPLWSYPSCRKLYNNKLSKVHMCAGGLGTDTCQGDSGGALQCRIPVGHNSYNKCSGWFLRGITSFGKGCNLHGQPGVYVDLSNAKVLLWIKDWIKVTRQKVFNPNRPIRLPNKIKDNLKKYT